MVKKELEPVLAWVKEAHDAVEQLYLKDPVGKDHPEWAQKRRLLLADMSLHLVQSALKGDALDPERLKRSLFSVLKLAQEFLPEAALLPAAEQLLAGPEPETNYQQVY